MKPKTIYPSEQLECEAFANYLRMKQIPFTHISNETYTTSWNQKRKNKLAGVSSGVPDYLCIVNNKLIFIEMKKVKGGVVSENQKYWIDQLNHVTNVYAHVCYGVEEAIQLIQKYNNNGREHNFVLEVYPYVIDKKTNNTDGTTINHLN